MLRWSMISLAFHLSLDVRWTPWHCQSGSVKNLPQQGPDSQAMVQYMSKRKLKTWNIMKPNLGSRNALSLICSICLKVISFLKPRLQLSKFSGAWYFLWCWSWWPQCSAHETAMSMRLCPRAGQLRWRSFKDSFIFIAAAALREDSCLHDASHASDSVEMLEAWPIQKWEAHIGTSRSVVTGLLTFNKTMGEIGDSNSFTIPWSRWARYWPRRLRLQGEGQHSAPQFFGGIRMPCWNQGHENLMEFGISMNITHLMGMVFNHMLQNIHLEWLAMQDHRLCKLFPNPRARPDLNWNCTAMVKGARLLHGNKSTLEKLMNLSAEQGEIPQWSASTRPSWFAIHFSEISTEFGVMIFKDEAALIQRCHKSRGQISNFMPFHHGNFDGSYAEFGCPFDSELWHEGGWWTYDTSQRDQEMWNRWTQQSPQDPWGSNTSAMRTLLSWPEQTTNLCLKKEIWYE